MNLTPRRAAILLMVGVILLAAGGAGWWQFGGAKLFAPASTPLPSPTPSPTFPALPPDFTPPPSLDELATQYPELSPILHDPELASVYKEFLVAYQQGGVEAARKLAYDRGILDDRERVRLTLVLDTTDTAALEAELKDNGVQVLGVYQTMMDIAIPMRVIEAAASQENPGAVFEKITQLPHVIRLRVPVKTQPHGDPVPGEGVQVTGANLWHQAGLTGQGVKVGVLDLGFKGYDQLLGRGLPQNVVARSFVPGEEPQDSAEVHGTAVTEIISEMAPDADLYLAYYDGGDVSFGNAVDWLVSQGVQIISNSTGGTIGPMDGSDADAALVDAVAARGILWVNSSGNEADVHYRGEFTDANGDGWHEFPGGHDSIGLVTGQDGLRVFLNWSDWSQVNQDFNLYVFDERNNLVASSEDSQDGGAGEWPVEVAFDRSISPETVLYARIRATNATRPVIFDLYLDGFALQFPVADHSLVSPADARGALAVGALDWASGELTDYSSRGPTNDGRTKPEIGAPTGVQSASYAPDTFTGTSASAPHVSGAAALVWSANPQFTADQVRQYLFDNAIDVPPAGPDSDTGYGALRLPPPPGVSMATVTAAAATEVAFVATAAPAPVASSPGDQASTTTAAIALTILCGGLFVCGFGLVLVGAIALVVVSGRRRPRPPAPPPPTFPIASPAAPAPLREAPPEGPSAAGRARLQLADGQVYDLRPPGVTLGRALECEIVLASTQVSRRHATLRLERSGWAITDLGSSNGTFLNGERLEPNVTFRLSSGDGIVFGGVGGEGITFLML